MENPEIGAVQPTESGYSEAQQAKQREGVVMDQGLLGNTQQPQPPRKKKTKARRDEAIDPIVRRYL